MWVGVAADMEYVFIAGFFVNRGIFNCHTTLEHLRFTVGQTEKNNLVALLFPA